MRDEVNRSDANSAPVHRLAEAGTVSISGEPISGGAYYAPQTTIYSSGLVTETPFTARKPVVLNAPKTVAIRSRGGRQISQEELGYHWLAKLANPATRDAALDYLNSRIDQPYYWNDSSKTALVRDYSKPKPTQIRPL